MWTAKHTAAFERLKAAFLNVKPQKRLVVNQNTLSYDDLILSIDFSKLAIAAVLGQVQGGVEQFIGAASRKCLEYEQSYHSSKGEFLALVFGIKKFETILRHQHFIVYTDNKLVVNWQTMKDQSHTFQRWFSFLAEFHFTVKFTPGKLNVNADLLSWLPPPEKPDDREPDEFVMRIGHKPEAKYLFEFGVNSIHGLVTTRCWGIGRR